MPHMRAFAFYGGVFPVIVYDSLTPSAPRFQDLLRRMNLPE